MKIFWLIFSLGVSFSIALHLKEHHDHTITVALSERIPFAFFDPNGTPKGLDVLIIENFARKFKLKIDYLAVNTSLNHIFATKQDWNTFLIENNLILKSDILIGGLDGNIPANEHFSASNSYSYDKLTWCIQKRKKIPAWQNAFHLFDEPIVWIIHAIMCIAVVFTSYFFQRFEDFKPKWNWSRITLAGVATCVYKAKLFPHRVFYIFGLYGSLVHAVVIMSGVIIILMKPIYEDQVKSIEEILDGSFEIVGDHFALQHMIRQDEVR